MIKEDSPKIRSLPEILELLKKAEYLANQASGLLMEIEECHPCTIPIIKDEKADDTSKLPLVEKLDLQAMALTGKLSRLHDRLIAVRNWVAGTPSKGKE